MKRHTFYTLMASCCLCLSISKTQAQVDLVDSVPRKGISLDLQGGYISSKAVPFWMRSNQYGSIPLEGASGSMIARAYQNYKVQGEWQGKAANGGTNWDWGYGLEGRANIGKEFQGQLIDAHVKVRFAMFEARLGRSKDVMGLNGDTLLTSGNFAVSGNALGVPKFEISIPEYYRLPWFGGLISFKGNFANGYMGAYDMNPNAFLVKNTDYRLQTYLHQKSLYVRLGRHMGPLQLYGGFNHQAQWGGESERYGTAFDLNFLQTLTYVTLGKAYGARGNPIPRSKIGNHQGSIDLGASYNLGDVSIMLYRQTFYDVGALSKLANIRDGLNGLTLTNNNFKKTNKSFDWNKILVEFFYSKDQAGYPWSKPTASGDEDYYNNSEYYEGWSYNGVGIGTPLIVTAKSVKPNQAHSPNDFFISNRVISGHLGAKGYLYGWNVATKATLSRHFGTYATSEFGKSTGRTFHTPHTERFQPVNQLSFIIQAEKKLLQNTFVGGSFAVDHGRLLYNGAGLLVNIRRTF
ncbi:capsule assembly Wzi family protein [Sphingobacterium bambusae]|uniref:Capsule assembly Wzi family protein n=1 Tax=Sphingobacterium bambusae TaxID=662858 RepID=A0ABW6BB34_9SPHI|nr:capsule assembly Wzi family protein [Sphingobacterium bambusae]WPL46888.1 capsule assembly Wzi family protein [Sphingobacterium bambusae]